MNNMLPKQFLNTLLLYCLMGSPLLFASGANFNDTSAQPLTSNVNPNFSTNVGIGSATPGQALDVNGTVRATGFVAGASGITLGGVTNTAWPNTSLWNTINTNDVYEQNGSTWGNVGIGTSITGGGALSVMNGNVGIGTWVPASALNIVGGNMFLSPTGSSTGSPREFGFSPSLAPGNAVQVQFGDGANAMQLAYGDRMQLFNYWGMEIHGNAEAASGISYVGGGPGDAALSIFAPGNGAGGGSSDILDLLNNSGSTTFVDVNSNGNVGIGTNITGGAGLSVMNGNVGIGTWVPANTLAVNGGINSTDLNVSNSSSGYVYTTVTNSNSAGVGGYYGTNDSGKAIAFFIQGSTYAIPSFRNNGTLSASDGINVLTDKDTANGGTDTFNIITGGFNNNATLTVTGGNPGNVGIGISTPGVALDVLGSVRSTGLTVNEATPTSGYVLTAIDSSGDTTWSAPGNISGAPWSISGSNVYTSGSNNVGIGTSTPQGAFVVTNGNVGIGTWVPAYPLEINNSGTGGMLQLNETSSSGYASLDMYGSGTKEGGFGYGASGTGSLANDIYFYATNNNNLIYSVNGGASAAMEINSSGNVGIGSTNPGQTLDVTGTVRATAFSLGGSTITSWPTGGSALWNTINTNDVYEQNGSTFGNVGIGTTKTTTAALTVMNGNVGIGTWAPQSPLQVIGLSDLNGPVYSQNNTLDDGTGIFYAAGAIYANSDVNVSGSVKSYQIQLVADGVQNLYYQNDGSLKFGTDASSSGYNRGRIVFSTGGGDSTEIAANANDETIYFGVTGLSTNSANISANNIAAAGNVAATGSVTAASAIFSGNVGIGSTNPGQKLDVKGTVRAIEFIGSGAGLTGLPSTGLWNTINTNDVYEQNGSTWGNVGIGTSITNGGAALSVMNGNVGIGTWVPGNALTVKGSSYLGSTVSTLNNSLDDGSGDIYASGDLTTSGILYAAGNSFSSGQGSQIGWNLSGGGGETDFVDNIGGGTGGFYFDTTTNGSTFSNWLSIFQGQLNLSVGGLSTYPNIDQVYLNYYEAPGDSYKRYFDINPVSAENGSQGGSVIRFLTNPDTSTTSVERMRIEMTGNVGIGSVAPVLA